MTFAFAPRAALGLLLGLVLPSVAAAAPAPLHTQATEIVSFSSGPADSDDDDDAPPPARIAGRVMRPAGPGPFPAVVMLHGCSGLYNASGALGARHLWWAMSLRDQGYLVLLVDSFRPRGVEQQCSEKERRVRATVERRQDADGALAYLRHRPDVRGDRVALMGWAQGGTTVLSAYGTDKASAAQEGYRGAIAFYPGCLAALRTPRWHPEGPMMVLVGDQDDWTPAEPCQELAARDSAKDRLELVVYPDAHHGFDLPPTPVRTRKDAATAPSGQAHVGTNEAARTDAVARVTAFLAKLLKSG